MQVRNDDTQSSHAFFSLRSRALSLSKSTNQYNIDNPVEVLKPLFNGEDEVNKITLGLK